MSEFSEMLRGTYMNYLEHLRNGGARQPLPAREPHDPELSVGKIHPNNLGECPLKAFCKRTKAEPVIPPTLAEQLNSFHVMEQGTRDAEIFQEAMHFNFPNSFSEESVSNDDLGIRGRLDCRFEWNDQWHIMEIKRRDGYTTKSAPTPKLSDVYQLLAYALLFPNCHYHIVLLNRWSGNLDKNPPAFQVWDLIPLERGFVLVNELGEAWDDPNNTSEMLSFEAVKAEIQLHHEFMNGERKHVDIDPLNGPFWCSSWVTGDKPKKYKSVYKGQTERMEWAKPNCEYWCHWPIEDLDNMAFLVREVGYEAGVYEPVDATPMAF